MIFQSTLALACGGFFCDAPPPPDPVLGIAQNPVEQAGETVVFFIDEASGTSTMHVRVAYQGPADEFAWVIPVPGTPALERSSWRVFDRALRASTPQWNLFETSEGCFGESDTDTDTDADSDTDSDADSDTDTLPPMPAVDVLDVAQVGPFQTVTLAANDETALVQWLQTNGYNVPNAMTSFLAPYISGGQNFVALRLQSDAGAGDLEPIALQLATASPSIPLRLTAVAATEDMPIRVVTIAQHRGVSTNYNHVELNPVQGHDDHYVRHIDEVIARAADEAGGRAFATLSSGTVLNAMGPEILPHPGLPGIGITQWLTMLPSIGLGDITLDELSAVAPLPADFPIPAQDFYNCPACYPTQAATVPFDAAAASAALQTLVIDPIGAAFEAAADKKVTLLETAISPSEMTVDPQFTTNTDLPVVELRDLDLEIVTDCTLDGSDYNTAPKRLSLGGLTFYTPGEAWASPAGYWEYLHSLAPDAALRIHQPSPDGSLTLLVDHMPEYNRQAMEDMTDYYGEDPESPPTLDTDPPSLDTADPQASPSGKDKGCGGGCRTAATGTVGWIGLFALLMSLRRRF